MAKDPAFLFYPNDYLGGTMGMTFEQKGAYIELLMLQFNRGHMTKDMIGHTVGQLWDEIQDKFQKDAEGKYFNVRLDEEKLKRQRFTESRRNNIKGNNQYTSKVGHTTSRMENEDENVIIDINTIENRIEIFINKVNKFQILDFTEAKKFIDYWTEHGERDKKCRWEKEKSFDISKRMNRWSNNIKSNNYGQSTTESHQQAIDGIDEITKRIVPQGNG